MSTPSASASPARERLFSSKPNDGGAVGSDDRPTVALCGAYAQEIICHIHTLLNGEIDGIANPTSAGMRSQRLYLDLFLRENRFYKNHRGWIRGRGTSEAILDGSRELDLSEPTASATQTRSDHRSALGVRRQGRTGCITAGDLSR